MSRLPEELMMTILLRLPIKTLGQLKCVSKSWRSLISDPFFVESHLNLTISDPNTSNHPKLLMMYPYNYFMMYPFYSLDYESPSSFEDIEDEEAIVDLGFPSREPDDDVTIVGSCNGLICLLYFPDSFILWNPTIKESKELPTPLLLPSSTNYLCFTGFGYDTSIDDYKVVTRAPVTNTNLNQSRLEVFSLKANCWRRIEDHEDSIVTDPADAGSCSNGALHWVGSRRAGPDKKRVIVSLDLGTEKFKEIPIPDFDNKKEMYVFRTMSSNTGCLGLLSHEFGTEEIEVWVMKEYGVSASWTKLIVLPLALFEDGGFFHPVCFTCNGDIVINPHGCVVRYNPNKKTVRYLKHRRDEFNIAMTSYVESMISPYVY